MTGVLPVKTIDQEFAFDGKQWTNAVYTGDLNENC